MITETKKRNIVHGFIIGTFVGLYLIVSIISTIHVIDFFKLSNPTWLAISLAIAFEIGAAASLAALIILEKTSKNLVWFLFIVLSAFQMMGNSYYAYMHLVDFQGWIDLFALNDMELIEQKRILSIISGAVLPLVALGFIKSLVDYIRPDVADLANEYDHDEKPKGKPVSVTYDVPVGKTDKNIITLLDDETIDDEHAEYLYEGNIKDSKSEQEKEDEALKEIMELPLEAEEEGWVDVPDNSMDEDKIIEPEPVTNAPTLDDIDEILKDVVEPKQPEVPKRYISENGKRMEIPEIPVSGKLNAVQKSIDNSKDINKDDILRRNT